MSIVPMTAAGAGLGAAGCAPAAAVPLLAAGRTLAS